MGCWGDRLFQSDDAFDLIGEMEEAAGFSLYFFNSPKDITKSRANLNEGQLDRLWARFALSGSHEMLHLVALAMVCGANLSQSYLQAAKQALRMTYLPPQSVAQLRKALLEYPNDGSFWDFEVRFNRSCWG